jgi:hypothetical protein
VDSVPCRIRFYLGAPSAASSSSDHDVVGHDQPASSAAKLAVLAVHFGLGGETARSIPPVASRLVLRLEDDGP